MRSSGLMNVGACVGLQQSLASTTDSNVPLNPFAGKNFYENENFRAALARMNGGYEVCMDLIELMQDYIDTVRTNARNLMSLHDKWIRRFKNQSPLSSYGTTKRAKIEVTKLAKSLAHVDEKRCAAVQAVVDKYRKLVEDTYISARLGTGREHKRSRDFKKLFKDARSSLVECAQRLETLRAREKKAREELKQADAAMEIVESDPTTNAKVRQRANDTQANKQMTLNKLKEQIEREEQAHLTAQKTYRKKAKAIFLQCQQEEEQRLDQIKDTLTDFTQAMHARNQTPELDKIYDELASNITTKQNSFDDLVFWATTYGIVDAHHTSSTTNVVEETKSQSSSVTNSEKTTKKSETTEAKTTKPETKKQQQQATVVDNNEDDDEASEEAEKQQTANSSIATTTNKASKLPKRTTKSTAAIPKASPVEPTSPNASVLGPV